MAKSQHCEFFGLVPFLQLAIHMTVHVKNIPLLNQSPIILKTDLELY
jgi:hypothetical protein